VESETVIQGLELLAPAGNEECLHAAVSAGADAVYFGLRSGLNARAKAQNFEAEDLPRVMGQLHAVGVRGYVTLNTLVFDPELERVARLIEVIASSGADAIIVQDLGVARLSREICPDLPVHASTQMTASSPAAARLVAELGIRRIVLPRELSLDEIRQVRRETLLELECFVHGALCMSYSGQCLASEAWGGRSANRGLCAQTCRLPFGVIVNGDEREPKGGPYVLSTRDLAALDRIGELSAAGVTSFKIEGRLKDATYVAAAVQQYRCAVDAATEHRVLKLDTARLGTLSYTFSRGFSHGYIDGPDYQGLVHGEHPGHRGLRVGIVEAVRGPRVTVRLHDAAPELRAGDWIVFDPRAPERELPQGGAFAVDHVGGDRVVLKFGDPGPDLGEVKSGHEVWKSHDPALERSLRKVATQVRKVPIDIDVSGRAGQPVDVRARDGLGRTAVARGSIPLQPALSRGLDEQVIREKLGSLGESPFELRNLTIDVVGDLAVPPSELKRLRRAITDALAQQPVPGTSRRLFQPADLPARCAPPPLAPPLVLVAMCRTVEHVHAALASGLRELELDFMDMQGLREATVTCRRASATVIAVTPRIQKPGEECFNRRLQKLSPDGIVVRHLGGLEQWRDTARIIGDFSLNVTNARSAHAFLGAGVHTLTPANDLNAEQLLGLARRVPFGCLEVILHQHLPLFHLEHCVYARELTAGNSRNTCGAPCGKVRLGLRDRLGIVHPVHVDVACRNTVFHAHAQSMAPYVRDLVAAGVGRFRVELLEENQAVAGAILAAYGDLLAGRRRPRAVLADIAEAQGQDTILGTLEVVGENVSPRTARGPGHSPHGWEKTPASSR
jgi:putative protease